MDNLKTNKVFRLIDIGGGGGNVIVTKTLEGSISAF